MGDRRRRLPAAGPGNNKNETIVVTSQMQSGATKIATRI
jgi:hypothetical protein